MRDAGSAAPVATTGGSCSRRPQHVVTLVVSATGLVTMSEFRPSRKVEAEARVDEIVRCFGGTTYTAPTVAGKVAINRPELKPTSGSSVDSVHPTCRAFCDDACRSKAG